MNAACRFSLAIWNGHVVPYGQQQSLSTTSNMDRQLLRQKSRQKLSVMKTKNWCFQKNSLCWHFNSRFVLKTTETPVFMFSLLRFF